MQPLLISNLCGRRCCLTSITTARSMRASTSAPPPWPSDRRRCAPHRGHGPPQHPQADPRTLSRAGGGGASTAMRRRHSTRAQASPPVPAPSTLCAPATASNRRLLSATRARPAAAVAAAAAGGPFPPLRPSGCSAHAAPWPCSPTARAPTTPQAPLRTAFCSSGACSAVRRARTLPQPQPWARRPLQATTLVPSPPVSVTCCCRRWLRNMRGWQAKRRRVWRSASPRLSDAGQGWMDAPSSLRSNIRPETAAIVHRGPRQRPRVRRRTRRKGRRR